MRHLLLAPLLGQFSVVALAQQTITSVITNPPSTVVVVPTTTTVSPDQTVTVTPTTPASPQFTDTTLFKDAVLNSTNFYRYEHNATFLAWNDSLATYAADYAPQCIWAHSHGAPGENLARGYPDITSAVDAWGDERSMYDFGNPPTGFTEATGHFTQLVWKSTQTVGCAIQNCNGQNGIQGWYLVCEYWPAGNIVGQGASTNAWFEVNVQNEINDGSGFDAAKATAGASGVGTSLASAGLPVDTGTSSSSGSQSISRTSRWTVGAVGITMVVLHSVGL